MDEIKLYGDALDRGRYAYTLFRVISEYAPKRPFEVIGTLPVIEDEEEEDTEDVEEYLSRQIVDKHDVDGLREEMLKDKPRPTRESSYFSKLKHLDNEAFIMSVSASWGSGKTTFMHMFADMLCGKGYEASPEITEFIDKNCYDKQDVAILDAWKNDFYEDPLNPLYKVLVDTLWNDDKAKELAWKKLENYKGELENKNGPSLSLEKKLEEMHTYIKEAIRDNKTKQRKLIVIIDELDRCKPTFAIKLLEIIKHLFNIRGIVFVFFLDIIQLSHCVKKVYGNGFDSLGYLERFFDYSSLMPKGERSLMFKSLAMEYDMAEKEDIDDFFEICKAFDLTAREMKAVCSSFHYLNKHELKEYPSYAKKLYFYLLVLKYKYPKDVQQLESIKNNEKARAALFTRHQWPSCLDCDISKGTEQPLFTALKENKVIKDGTYRIVQKRKVDGREQVAFEEGKKLLEQPDSSLSCVIFKNDLSSSNIENQHLLEYMFRKIELYDTVIGSDAKDETLRPGTVLKFGRWPMTKEGAIGPIQWQVLAVEEDRALLLSRYALDVVPYNDEMKNVTWETCTLRKWLYNEKNENDTRTFYAKAFNEDEKGLIQLRTVKAEKNPEFVTGPGNDTNDKVFLLSIQEAERYLPSRRKRECEATEYALEGIRKVFGDDDFEKYYGDDPRCAWWLRSPGDDSFDAAVVDIDGDVDAGGILVRAVGDGVNDDIVGVRPALWLILNP